MWLPMLTKGTGICRALENNIHIVSSMVVHAVVGVFFITGTHKPIPHESTMGLDITVDEGMSSGAEARVSGVSEPHENAVGESVNNPGIPGEPFSSELSLLPPGNTSKPAKMSLAMSSSNWTSQELSVTQQSDKNSGALPSYEFVQYSKKDSLHSDPEIVGLFEKYVPDNVIGSVVDQFAECWTIPSDVKSDGNVVRINLALDENGKVTTAAIADTYLYDHSQSFRALADSALRAVYKCSPLAGLKEADYSLWNEVVLTFDPRHTS